MYVKDLEQELNINGVNVKDIGMVKLLVVLYADDIVLFAKSAEELQKSLNILEVYSDRWNLTVNDSKTNIVIFRKRGRLPADLQFNFKGSKIEIVNKVCYLGIVFTYGSSFETQKKKKKKKKKKPFRTSFKSNLYTEEISV